MKNIRITENNSVFEMTFCRSEKRNAFNAEMIAEITQAFKVAGQSQNKLVYLHGEGASFCAGADLEWMKSMKDFTFEENLKDSNQLFNMFESIQRCEIPILTRVHGHVMGGANGILAVSDFVIAEEKTKFSFSEVKLGLAPAVISPFVLQKMSFSSASEKMLSGRVFSSQEAREGGLVHFVISGDQLDSFVDQFKSNLLALGPQAVRSTKKLISQVSREMNWENVKQLCTKVIAERRVSSEGQEGLAAFFEKRPPSW